MKKVQFGESIGGNLKESTWEFEITSEDFNLSAGKFAIVPEKEYEKLLEQRDNLIAEVKELRKEFRRVAPAELFSNLHTYKTSGKLIKSIESDGE